jgi:hypothetical protein
MMLDENYQKDPTYPVFRAALVVVFLLGVFVGTLLCYIALRIIGVVI